MNNVYTPPNAQSEDEAELMRRRRRDALALRILVLLKPPIIIIAIIVGNRYSVESPTTSPTVTPDMHFIWFGPAMVLGAIVSWIGLLFLKRWAGWLFMITYVTMNARIVDAPNSIPMHPYKGTIEWVGTSVSAAIIVLVFFSCALIQKKKVAEQTTASPLTANRPRADGAV